MQSDELSGKLARAFLSKLQGGAACDSRRLPEDLASRLLAMFERGRGAWPGLNMEPEVFASYIGERVSPEVETEVDAALHELRADDLYLACACVHGVPEAIRAADEAYLSSLTDVLHHVDSSPGFADEVRQIIRTKLFVSADGMPPKIAGYTGRHPLAAWMRVAARRVGISLRRGDAARSRAGAMALSEALPPGENPELDYLRVRYRGEFREAFRAAIDELTERERAVLRFSIVERLSHEKIALLYGVTQPTVTRWIAGATRSIAKHVQQTLCKRLKLSEPEVESIARLIRSRLELSLTRWLADEAAPERKRSNDEGESGGDHGAGDALKGRKSPN